METLRICPNCRKPLPPDVPLGLCPECLIKAGFPTETGPGGAGEAAGARFVPPPVEEIAQLFPQLEILSLIGKGGMGAVYKARQPMLDRFIALKVLPPAVAGDPGFAERFNREARALARLNHQNIVAVYDFGRVGSRRGDKAEVPQSAAAPPHVGGYESASEGLYYLLMEFVDGTNLRQVEQAGKLSSEQALTIVPKICEALQYAHDQGVVHRDIKPENILLDKTGRVKIADFGIAKMIGRGETDVSLTGARDVVGTPHYMAPEQIEKPQAVDHRADIYSLGVVFYEMLTGELPLGKFAAPSTKVHVDVRLDEVVLHTLEKEPSRRYQHASQVKSDVETITGTAGLGGRAGGGPDQQRQGHAAGTFAGLPLRPVRCASVLCWKDRNGVCATGGLRWLYPHDHCLRHHGRRLAAHPGNPAGLHLVWMLHLGRHRLDFDPLQSLHRWPGKENESLAPPAKRQFEDRYQPDDRSTVKPAAG